MTTLDGSGSDVNVVVLDACRDNPLPATASRSASRGLSVVQTKPKNSLIVYAAEPGSKADDGLFTPTLAELIGSPGKSLSQIFKEVRRLVYKKSGGSQTPGEYDQLFDDVYLCDSNINNIIPSMSPAAVKYVEATNNIQNNVTPPSAPPNKIESSKSPLISTAKNNASNDTGNGIVKMNMSNRGSSSVDSEATPFGRYKKAVADVIGSRWYYYTAERMGALSKGTVSVGFKVTPAGKVSKLHVISSNGNEALTDCALRSIMDAKLPRIPMELLESKGNDGIEFSGGINIDYDFTVY
jgi:TonB family protein